MPQPQPQPRRRPAPEQAWASRDPAEQFHLFAALCADLSGGAFAVPRRHEDGNAVLAALLGAVRPALSGSPEGARAP